MKKLNSFLKTSLLGGVIVVLPVAILVVIFSWIFKLVTGVIEPFTKLIVATSDVKELLANLVVLSIIVVSCFLIGVFVKTGFGRYLHGFLETRLLSSAPGYNMIKEIILQFFGGKKAPFSRVALVRPFNNDTLVTAFVTDEHPDGRFTLFIPMAPPTSGFVFHLKKEQVQILDIGVEDAMRSIIGFGSGSTKIMESFKAQAEKS